MRAAMLRAHEEVVRLMKSGDWRGADAACRGLTAGFPHFAPGWLAAGHIAWALGRREDALEAAAAAARCAPADPLVQDAVGTLCSGAGEQRRALEACERAVAQAPQDPRYRFNRASVRRFVGDLKGAEDDYDHVIARRPDDYEAYLNRSELRVQTAARNHVTQLEALLTRPIADWRGRMQIHYALAKEYEDLGEDAQSFAHLREGAGLRRSHMNYDVAIDVATVDWIIDAFPAGADGAPGHASARTSERAREPAIGPHSEPAASMTGAAAAPTAAQSPIFIVGLPRSGTTLVERILGSHSAVSSAGELDCFALALVDAVRRESGRDRIARRELVALSATLDFAALGRDYLQRARDRHGASGRFIDKMPLNYLYCGLIRRALPHATIIHMTRHPMAAGYAIYKTLFKDAYPFSYDLGDIARYYVAYRRLMAHWHAALPGELYELRYETLVADLHGETRKLLSHCGLEWQDACAEFHRNPSATTTASAVQVRRPLYDSSVAQWRRQATQLDALRAALESAGIHTG
jgi:tetratricopeptide (TPR) repeat protein